MVTHQPSIRKVTIWRVNSRPVVAWLVSVVGLVVCWLGLQDHPHMNTRQPVMSFVKSSLTDSIRQLSAYLFRSSL